MNISFPLSRRPVFSDDSARGFSGSCIGFLILVSVAVCLEPLHLNAQNANTNQAASQQQAADRNNKREEVTIPPVENLSLETKDRVVLKCTFFPAPKDEAGTSGKSTIPFILVHDWGGSRKDMLAFGEYLQSLGCAVIIPDLRGHGESTSVVGAAASLDHSKLRKSEIASVVLDIERCKKFLVQKNNDGELNIDLLNIMAVGKTCVFAVDWTISDWSWPTQGAIKQGQDVKSVILVAPQKKLENLSLNKSLKHPLFSGRAGINIPTMVVWSSNDEVAAKDCESIFEYMEKGRPDLDKIEDLQEREAQTTLIKAVVPRTRLSGTELIRSNQVQGLWPYIANFVSAKVGMKRDDYRWQSRKRE